MTQWNRRPTPLTNRAGDYIIDCDTSEEATPLPDAVHRMYLQGSFSIKQMTVAVTSEPIEAEMPWLREYYALDDESIDPEAIKSFFVQLDPYVKNSKFGVLGNLISNMSYSPLCLTLKEAILRYLSPARGQISEWPVAVTKLRLDVQSAGEDANVAVAGL